MSALLTSAAGFDYEEHFRAERRRLLELLSTVLRRQRARGRTPASDGLGGRVIEHGEAEGLLGELEEDWSDSHGPPRDGHATFATSRDGIARRSDEATATSVPLPLWHARRMFQLEPDQYDALLLALLVERDARAARLVAYLNDHASQPRPTVGLVQALALLQGIASDPLTWSERPVLADGLLTLEGSGPLPTRTLRIDDIQAHRLTSLDATPDPALRVSLPDSGLLQRLVLGEDLRRRVATWAERIRAGDGIPAVVVT